MEMNFKGRKALVTGAGKGIGRGIAIALVKAGAETYGISRTKEDLESLSEEAPGIHTIQLDISDWDETRRIVGDIGGIDLLVNNAGNNILAKFLDVEKEQIDKLFDINYKAVVNISQVVCRGLVEREAPGCVVNVSSRASYVGLDKHTVYCSTKASVDSLTKCMAQELGKHQIRVNSVNPTVCLTELGKAAWSDPVLAKPMLDRIPRGSFIEVDEIVNTVLFLLSDRSSGINGQCLLIDAGSTYN